MKGRFEVTKEDVLNKMKSIQAGDYEKTMKFSETTQAIVGPSFTDGETGDILTARQYAVARAGFLKCSFRDKVDAWWEIFDFVEASKNEILSYTELQVLCLLLETWVCSFNERNPQNQKFLQE